MFNHHLLDMCELSVNEFKPMHKFKARHAREQGRRDASPGPEPAGGRVPRGGQGVEKPAAFSKPCMIFNGHCWEQETDFRNLRSMFLDLFRGPVVDLVNLGKSPPAERSCQS
jgi:hypothetical protein